MGIEKGTFRRETRARYIALLQQLTNSGYVHVIYTQYLDKSEHRTQFTTAQHDWAGVKSFILPFLLTPLGHPRHPIQYRVCTPESLHGKLCLSSRI